MSTSDDGQGADSSLQASGSSGNSGNSDPGKLILAINEVIVAVGGTFASTHSLAATVVAGCVGLACAALFARRK